MNISPYLGDKTIGRTKDLHTLHFSLARIMSVLDAFDQKLSPEVQKRIDDRRNRIQSAKNSAKNKTTE